MVFELTDPLGIIEIIAAALGLFTAAYHAFLKHLLKEHKKAAKEAAKVNEEVTQDLNVKSIGKMGGAFASDYIATWLSNLEKDILNVQAEIARIQGGGTITPEGQKQIEALNGKLKQMQWVLQNRDMLMHLNSNVVPAVVQRVAMRVLGGLGI